MRNISLQPSGKNFAQISLMQNVSLKRSGKNFALTLPMRSISPKPSGKNFAQILRIQSATLGSLPKGLGMSYKLSPKAFRCI